jgi:hypothetical protein
MAAATLTEQVAPVEQAEVQAVVTPIAPAEKQQSQQQPVVNAGQQHQAALAAVLRAAKRLKLEARFESLRRYYEKVRSWVWFWIEELLEVGGKWFELQGGHSIQGTFITAADTSRYTKLQQLGLHCVLLCRSCVHGLLGCGTCPASKHQHLTTAPCSTCLMALQLPAAIAGIPALAQVDYL